MEICKLKIRVSKHLVNNENMTSSTSVCCEGDAEYIGARINSGTVTFIWSEIPSNLDSIKNKLEKLLTDPIESIVANWREQLEQLAGEYDTIPNGPRRDTVTKQIEEMTKKIRALDFGNDED